MLKGPNQRIPPQTLCSCLVPKIFEYNHKVYCKKCGYIVNPNVIQVVNVEYKDDEEGDDE